MDKDKDPYVYLKELDYNRRDFLDVGSSDYELLSDLRKRNHRPCSVSMGEIGEDKL